MIVSKEELRFDFKGASFDLGKDSDRSLLGWVFDQFLYGEVTGIQCGHWLYRAPHLNAAAFLAKQASEEISHVKRILRIFTLLGEKPKAAHPAIRFLSTGMMGGSWGEHVALEMALGEGLVLGVFYAMADTIPDEAIKKILETAAVEEERHVEFGEKETQEWLKSHPETRSFLLGSALLQWMALTWLKKFVMKKLMRGEHMSHPVLSQFGEFYDHCLRAFQLRMDRLKLSERSVADFGLFEKVFLVATLPLKKLWFKLMLNRRLLTTTYLEDPVIESEMRRSGPS